MKEKLERWYDGKKQFDLELDNLICILENDEINGKEKVLQLLKSHKEELDKKYGKYLGFGYRLQNGKECKECKALNDLVKVVREKDTILALSPYHVDSEKDLSDILIRYMYDNLTPYDTIVYTFDNGLEIIRPKEYPNVGCRVTTTSIECYGEVEE